MQAVEEDVADQPTGPDHQLTSAESTARRRQAAICIFAAAIGLAIVWYGLAQPRGLYAVKQYDDGVYYGSAVRLVSGILPYRDYALLQPPGIAVVGSPIAWLTHANTREGLALARMLTALVAACNVFLAAWLIRHKGLLAAGIAGIGLAIYPTAYSADSTFMLEPYLILGCLIGACAVFRRGVVASPWRIALGGVAFGVAGSVKLWAIVPVAVLAFCLLPKWRTAVLPFAGGVTLGFAAICLPFFIAAPHNFVNDVFSSQLGRDAPPTRFTVHIWNLVGFRDLFHATTPLPSEELHFAVAALLVAVVLAGILTTVLSKTVGRLEAYVFAAATVITVALFIPHQFYSHYVYVTGAFIAIALGDAIGTISAPLRARVRSGESFNQLAVGIAGLLIVIGILGAGVITNKELAFDTNALKGSLDPGIGIEAAIPAGSCVISDAASYLIAGSRFKTPPNCPVFLDSTGAWIALDPNNPPVPKTNCATTTCPSSLIASWASWFKAADYVVITQQFRIPWTPSLRNYFDKNYTRIPAAGAVIYRHVRTTAPPTNAVSS